MENIPFRGRDDVAKIQDVNIIASFCDHFYCTFWESYLLVDGNCRIIEMHRVDVDGLNKDINKGYKVVDGLMKGILLFFKTLRVNFKRIKIY